MLCSLYAIQTATTHGFGLTKLQSWSAYAPASSCPYFNHVLIDWCFHGPPSYASTFKLMALYLSFIALLEDLFSLLTLQCRFSLAFFNFHVNCFPICFVVLINFSAHLQWQLPYFLKVSRTLWEISHQILDINTGQALVNPRCSPVG